MRSWLVLWLTLISVTSVQSQTFQTGKYSGIFEFGNFSTGLIVDIENSSGTPQVFFSSPESNAYRIPGQEVFTHQDSIHFALQSDYYRYDFTGHVNSKTLDLSLSVDNKTFPISLKSVSSKSESGIKSKDIRFRSGELLLYGTVFLPEVPNGKAIYIVTSSGNQDRSASRAEAQYLAQQGYVTMHADKRGTGLSDGNWQKASIQELCEDDLNAITYLKESNKLNYNNIGIKGSSQGATKVPYILSKRPDLGFGILVSCPASSLLESDLNYWKNRNKNQLSEDELKQAEEMQRLVFLYIAGEVSKKDVQDRLDEAGDSSWLTQVWVPKLDSVEIDRKLNYTPLPFLQKTNQPILVIQGSSDDIIPEYSLDKIRLLTKSSNPLNRYVELKQADHAMMFKGQSDFPYWPSLHREYRDSVSNWLKEL